MRLIEIAPQSNNKQQLNEFAFVPILIGMATAGLTLTDLWNYKKRYNAAGGGQAGWDAIKNDVYQDAAFIAAGGAVGKVIHLGYKSWKRAKDAKKAVGDSPKPLTNKEKSLAKKIDKITAKDTVATRAAQKDAFNIPKIPPVWKRVNWSNAMRTLVAPFGSKAANDFRALPKEAQEIFLRRAANAKRAKKNQEIDATREKIDKHNKSKTGDNVETGTVQNTTKVKNRPEPRTPDAVEAERIRLDNLYKSQAATKTAKEAEEAAAELARKAEINQARLGREMEIDALSSTTKAAPKITTVPSGAIRTTTSTSPSLDALNRVVQRASKKSIKGTEHAMDAGKAISRGIENTL